MVFIFLFKPSEEDILNVLLQCQRQGFNYAHVGATKEDPPRPAAVTESEKWVVDHTRVKVGKGRQTYEQAKKLVQNWSQFQLGWCFACPPSPVQASGQRVCIAAQTLLLWVVNPLQICYINEQKQRRKQQFSLAHGCVKGHLLSGEERFAVEWDKEDDSVWYDVYTFSKADHILSQLTYPVARFYQNKFRQDSSQRMLRLLQAPEAADKK